MPRKWSARMLIGTDWNFGRQWPCSLLAGVVDFKTPKCLESFSSFGIHGISVFKKKQKKRFCEWLKDIIYSSDTKPCEMVTVFIMLSFKVENLKYFVSHLKRGGRNSTGFSRCVSNSCA